jgi:hypothetical protein
MSKFIFRKDIDNEDSEYGKQNLTVITKKHEKLFSLLFRWGKKVYYKITF